MSEPKPSLYIKVKATEALGEDHDEGDGSAWSGYTHTVLTVHEWGPCYIASEGKGFGHHRVRLHGHNSDARLAALLELYPEAKELFFVIVRYGDGGTFGFTEGQFEFRGVFSSRDLAEEFAAENRDEFEAQHNGYFETYEGYQIERVPLVNEADVPRDE